MTNDETSFNEAGEYVTVRTFRQTLDNTDTTVYLGQDKTADMFGFYDTGIDEKLVFPVCKFYAF